MKPRGGCTRPAAGRGTRSSSPTPASSEPGVSSPLAPRSRAGGTSKMANPVMWFEIMGKDSAGLQRFYHEVFAWKLSPPVKEMGNYSMLERPDTGIGGGIGEGDARGSVYVETPDPQRVGDKAGAARPTGAQPGPRIN